MARIMSIEEQDKLIDDICKFLRVECQTNMANDLLIFVAATREEISRLTAAQTASVARIGPAGDGGRQERIDATANFILCGACSNSDGVSAVTCTNVWQFAEEHEQERSRRLAKEGAEGNRGSKE